jgi:hypothetical protein
VPSIIRRARPTSPPRPTLPLGASYGRLGPLPKGKGSAASGRAPSGEDPVDRVRFTLQMERRQQQQQEAAEERRLLLARLERRRRQEEVAQAAMARQQQRQSPPPPPQQQQQSARQPQLLQGLPPATQHPQYQHQGAF